MGPRRFREPRPITIRAAASVCVINLNIKETQSGGAVSGRLAVAKKQNPNLKAQLNGGYYDLATPCFAAEYELHQLPIQSTLQGNIEMHFYTSGHMVYALEPDLKALHANVSAFIDRTKNGNGK